MFGQPWFKQLLDKSESRKDCSDIVAWPVSLAFETLTSEKTVRVESKIRKD